MTSTDAHPMWLPDAAFRPLGRRRVLVAAAPEDGPVAATVVDEVAAATAQFGGSVTTTTPDEPLTADEALTHEVVLAVVGSAGQVGTASARLAPPPGTVPRTDAYLPAVQATLDGALVLGRGAPWNPGMFTTVRRGGRTVVAAADAAGLLHGLHDLVRRGESAFTGPDDVSVDLPVNGIRMLDHWDNVDVHPVMGQVERGYSGGSIFYADGRVREDLSRVAAYARLLGSVGINAVAINNVNVARTEARLLTDGLPDVARIAALFRPHGIRVHLSVSFAAPMTVGGLPTSDPLDPDVQAWWAARVADVYAVVPDFGGFVVKADSEGQPGPFAYGRDQADGANLLARALKPFGGTVFWRAFVYDHKQDWRDRSTDRARAAFDHFSPLDGRFDDNVVLQVKYGPMDFQTREPVSPVIAAMPRTRLALELQVTQEYTGQQKHAVWLGPQWSQILGFPLWGEGGRTVADVAAGLCGPTDAPRAGLVAVSNVGDDAFWTGHPLAQANLYTFARLAWSPEIDPVAVLDEWIGLTFPDADDDVRATLHGILDDSWRTYEDYTAPLGVGFMVRPGHHYGPDVDGYEYTPWGTYHFADRDGIGVDRTRATGTGFTGQYPAPWRDVYEDVATCPDELLLFFHHVPWSHGLRSGVCVAQHVYDTHWEGAARTERNAEAWAAVAGKVPADLHARVTERLAEQVRSAHEWRDQLRTYVHRHSGLPDATGRTLY
ncbi:alpha-glucuronidase [Cellulomonas fimi]|uniref:Alpha-glucuronidase n=1 Tax=Cellulomonas fimi (strain ATCC 484 / DSM 20113 / JCM 1341 / CCUG 24087 / LMG 16345 / NBRC 15513 / NCIMB 8980 / NCTC 7547 / NRS-133) TaxID=590998 RepID=F4H113_CELFA|nr:alpha-glucuronidase [Cellulomonas fimi]AEE47382.1 Alpha-glucuronidase [Cellulomonas fimi ATCC 484]VEH36069.1 Alpha-glucuronidase [Cellulomonas fimi]